MNRVVDSLRPLVLLVSAVIVLTGDGATAWSAEVASRSDGRIAVVANESDLPLVVMDADGKHRHVVARVANAASWSPDCRTIAVAIGRDIRLVDPSGHRGAGVDQHRLLRRGFWPRWSPSGKKLAFQRGRDIWVFDLARKRERRLIRNGGEPSWSPDGAHLAFARGYTTIYVARSDGGGHRRLANGDTPVWSPDGREVAFIGGPGDWSLVRVRLGGSARRVLFPKPCRMPAWSRDP